MNATKCVKKKEDMALYIAASSLHRICTILTKC